METIRKIKVRFGWRAIAVLALMLTLVLGGVGTALATLTGSTFEGGDGNLAVDTSGLHDWNSPVQTITCPNTTPGSGVNCGTDLAKSGADNAFGQGAKEDNPSPTIVSGSIPPNKSDLTRFYINRESAGGNDFLYLAWERSNVLGSANMDFEINQVATPGGNGVTPIRTAGDLLITFDFTQGGGNPVLGMLRWVTSGPTSQCFASNSLPCWGNRVDLSASGFAEGQVNTVTVHDGNPPPAGGFDLPGLTFGEAAINLQGANIFPPNQCQHFGSAFLKSRSSASFTSELKDFIAPVPINIANCGQIIIHKVTNPDPDPTDTSFSYSTTGGLSPANFSLKNGGTQDYGSTVFAGSYSVTEADPGPTFAFDNIDCSASGLSHGSTVTTTNRTVNIDLKPEDKVECTYTNNLQLGAISITKTSSKDGSNLAGAEFNINGPSGAFTLTTNSNGVACQDNLVFGDYTVQETNPPGGYAADDATAHTVTVDSAATCGSGSEETISFTDTPLSRITVSFESLAPGDPTSATIQCTNEANPAPLPEGTPKVLDNLTPGTYACTVVVDP